MTVSSRPKSFPVRARWVAASIAALLTLPLAGDRVRAADHLDAPKTQDNILADITDVYAWHTGDGKIVAVVNFAGLNEAGAPTRYSSDVLYGIHVDNDGDNEPDHDVWIRFGQNSEGAWGVKVQDLPGGQAEVIGPVQSTIDAGLGLRVWAGLRDDPFFFDLVGFNMTLMSGDLSFDAKRDTFAKTNVTSIVVEMSTDAVVGAGTTFKLWASTRVKP